MSGEGENMDVEIEQPHRHHPTGHFWLDKLLPLSAVLISVVSIGIALHHGKVMESLVHQNERLVQANSLPHIQLFNDLTNEADGDINVSMGLANRGVGPAEIRAVRILVDGRPVGDLAQLLAACCGGKNGPVGNSTIFATMMQAGQEVRYVTVPPKPASREMALRLIEGLTSNRIVTEICYCSVFGECWTRSSKSSTWPKRVDACSMPEPQYRY